MLQRYICPVLGHCSVLGVSTLAIALPIEGVFNDAIFILVLQQKYSYVYWILHSQ
jgi:hypothetical protein